MEHAMSETVPTVADVMNRKVHVFSPGMPVAEALRELARHGWSGAVVCDDMNVPLGVFSEMDALRVLANSRFHGNPEGTVADHMSRSVMTVSPSDDALTVALRLIGDGVRRYPVVDDGGHLIGLVTVTDLAALLARQADRRHPSDHPPGAAWDPEASRKRDTRH